MTLRRTLLVALLAAVLAAALFAVRSCALPSEEHAPPEPGGDRARVDEVQRAERRRVREPVRASGERPGAESPADVPDPLVFGAEGEPDAERAIAARCEFVITVTDGDGTRVPGVEVLVRGDDRRGRGWSGAQGLLDLSHLGRGEGASQSGLTDLSGVARITAPLFRRMRFRAASDAWYGEAAVSQVSGPGPIEVPMTVVPGFRLGGRVVHEDGSPVRGARVYVAAPLPGLASRQPRRLDVVTTDDEGGFRCDVHPVPETRVIECYVMAADAAGTSIRFPVAAGARTDVELVVPRGGVILGRCVDEEGTPLAGVRVRGILPGTGEITFTGPDGRFSMKVPGAGGGLIFYLPGRVQTGRAELRGAPEGTDIGDVLIPRGGALSGRVVDESGAALAGATVWVVEPVTRHAAANTRTGPDGAFQADLIGPGMHHLLVRHRAVGDPWGPLSSHRIDGFTAGTTDATVVLQPATWATLEVRDPDSGEPLVFETGAFTLRRLDAPEYVAAHHVFETKGETRSAFPFQLPGPGSYEIELELPESGAVDRRRLVVGNEPIETVVLTPR